MTQQSHLVCLGRRVNGVFTERDGMMGTGFAPSPVFGGFDALYVSQRKSPTPGR
ncbi:MAG: hypothetical protein NTW96_22220 [Planctomycetia bacterium]|nr:hypothetical protein [Planctomycetia bacterium]